MFAGADQVYVLQVQELSGDSGQSDEVCKAFQR
jgi:hypothetical protein